MKKKLNKAGRDINKFLKNFLKKQKRTELITSMNYGLFPGGKKIRSKIIIDVGKIFGLVWFIAGLLASLAGFFITGGFNTLTQFSFISALRALPAVVIGGLDSIPGAVVGSLIIGLTQGYVAYFQPNLDPFK